MESVEFAIRYPDGREKAVHTITLGDGKVVTVGQFVRAWRAVKSGQFARFDRSMRDDQPAGRDEILRQISDMCADLINRHLPWYGKGRKWNDHWQHETHRAAYNINRYRTDRVRFHWLPPWLKQRFGHLIDRKAI